LAEVTHEFDVAFQRTRVKGGTRIEHSTACYVLGPGGTLDGAFDTPISPAALRRRLGL